MVGRGPLAPTGRACVLRREYGEDIPQGGLEGSYAAVEGAQGATTQSAWMRSERISSTGMRTGHSSTGGSDGPGAGNT